MTDISDQPQIYRALNRITQELSKNGIPKRHFDSSQGYHYRSADDVLERLSPLFARHRVCVLPSVVRREQTIAEAGRYQVALQVDFTLLSARDGSRQTISAWGEGIDDRDRATAKAMASAFKSAMLFTFCVPARGPHSAGAGKPTSVRPTEGWSDWAGQLKDAAKNATSQEALRLLRVGAKSTLQAMQRENPDLYQELGADFARRGSELDVDGVPIDCLLERP